MSLGCLSSSTAASSLWLQKRTHMPPSTATARQSHHLNEPAQEAAFHRAALREARIFNRTLPHKERHSAKLQAVSISKTGHGNADSGFHECPAGDSTTEASGCFSCFLLPVKRAKEVSKASTFQASTESSRGKTQNGSKASPACKNASSASPLGRVAPVSISKPLSDVTKAMQNTTKSSPVNTNNWHAPSQGRIKKASSISSGRPEVADTLGKATCRSNLSGTHKSPVVAPPITKSSSRPTSVNFIKPHLAARSSSKSSPPMNISNPQSAETLSHITRKSSPMSPINAKSILEKRNPLPKQSAHACRAHAFHLQKGPRAVRFTEPSEGEKVGLSRIRVDGATLPVSNAERRVVWREGLLQRLGRLHGLGNCKLSLEELIELDDNACLEELETPQERTSFAQGAHPSSTRPSIASTWNMEFEGGKPILPLQRQDVSPELVPCVWPFSHTNSLFEASRRHRIGNYSHEECK